MLAGIIVIDANDRLGRVAWSFFRGAPATSTDLVSKIVARTAGIAAPRRMWLLEKPRMGTEKLTIAHANLHSRGVKALSLW